MDQRGGGGDGATNRAVSRRAIGKTKHMIGKASAQDNSQFDNHNGRSATPAGAILTVAASERIQVKTQVRINGSTMLL